MDPILSLENSIMPYDWGSTTAFTEILGIENPDRRPMAELWMGAHPKAASRVRLDSGWTPLDRLIDRCPVEILGPEAAARYGGKLPFLFKVLAAEKPLSIQAHPDRRQAEEGFRREEAQGVPRDDGRRNYRDPNPKPECLWALEPFEGLCGFRSPPVILKHLEALCPAGLAPELGLFRERPDAGGLRRLFASLLGFAPDRCRSILKEALARRDRIDAEAGRWIARLHDSFDTGGPGSRPEIAILSPAWLEILKLAPGRLVFLPAGVLHSYLQGVGLEIMANSDNVVRGGLTDKNIDIAELMRILDFEREPPRVGEPIPAGPLEKRFQGPAAEFALSEIRMGPGDVYAGRSARAVEIFLCTQGRAHFLPPAADAPLLAIGRGESCLVPAATPGYRLSGPAVVYKATVGKEGGAAPAG